MTQLEKLKIRLGIKDNKQDDALMQMLEDAGNEILDYCNRNTLPTKLDALQRELTIIYYNRSLASGEKSRSEGGISVTYDTEIPLNIKERLKAYRKLKAVERV